MCPFHPSPSFAGSSPFLALSSCSESHEYSGRVVAVHDGDTLTVLTASREQVKIRLFGIDPPELKQAFGNRAKQALLAARLRQQCSSDREGHRPIRQDRGGRIQRRQVAQPAPRRTRHGMVLLKIQPPPQPSGPRNSSEGGASWVVARCQSGSAVGVEAMRLFPISVAVLSLGMVIALWLWQPLVAVVFLLASCAQ